MAVGEIRLFIMRPNSVEHLLVQPLNTHKTLTSSICLSVLETNAHLNISHSNTHINHFIFESNLAVKGLKLKDKRVLSKYFPPIHRLKERAIHSGMIVEYRLYMT